MPRLVLSTGEQLGILDGVPCLGAEIEVFTGPLPSCLRPRVFVVVGQRWRLGNQHDIGRCFEIVVMERAALMEAPLRCATSAASNRSSAELFMVQRPRQHFPWCFSARGDQTSATCTATEGR